MRLLFAALLLLPCAAASAKGPAKASDSSSEVAPLRPEQIPEALKPRAEPSSA